MIDCRLSDPKVRVKLKQQLPSGVKRERFADGCRVSRVGQKFVIRSVDLNDGGIYMCEEPSASIRQKQEVYLTVKPGKVTNGLNMPL